MGCVMGEKEGTGKSPKGLGAHFEGKHLAPGPEVPHTRLGTGTADAVHSRLSPMQKHLPPTLPESSLAVASNSRGCDCIKLLQIRQYLGIKHLLMKSQMSICASLYATNMNAA